jgi:hypothetical protein
MDAVIDDYSFQASGQSRFPQELLPLSACFSTLSLAWHPVVSRPSMSALSVFRRNGSARCHCNHAESSFSALDRACTLEGLESFFVAQVLARLLQDFFYTVESHRNRKISARPTYHLFMRVKLQKSN